jgi:hypothetical protein
MHEERQDEFRKRDRMNAGKGERESNVVRKRERPHAGMIEHKKTERLQAAERWKRKRTHAG